MLTTVALYYWPWRNIEPVRSGVSPRVIALLIAALTFMVRPTSAIIWVVLGLQHLFLLHWKERVRFVMAEVVPIGYATRHD